MLLNFDDFWFMIKLLSRKNNYKESVNLLVGNVSLKGRHLPVRAYLSILVADMVNTETDIERFAMKLLTTQ